MYRRAGTGTKETAAEVLLDTSRYLEMTSFPESLQAATRNNHTKCEKGEEVLLLSPLSGLRLRRWKSRGAMDRGFANEIVG